MTLDDFKADTQLNHGAAEDGPFRFKPLPSRGELARCLAGIGKAWLKPGDDPVGDLIHERLEDPAD